MSVSHKKSGSAGSSYYVKCMSIGGGNSATDYYASTKNSIDGAKEPPGIWYCGLNKSGNRNNSLGIKDGVSFDSQTDSHDIERFQLITQGWNPETGGSLVQNAGTKDRLAFHDFCLSAPKSVSVLFSQADDVLKQRIEDANTQAGRSFLDFMSKHSYSRQGKGGIIKSDAPLMAALFPHASSRENDPQIHCHVVVFNACQREDGTTGSLENAAMMRWQGAAASIYHADLAWRLREIQFGIEKKGNLFEVQGVPENVMEAFSQRRAQILHAVEQKMIDKGLDPSSAKVSKGLLQVATLETRDAKNELSREELQKIWHERGSELGFSSREVDLLMSEGPAPELSNQQLLEEARLAVQEITETNPVSKEPALLTKIAVNLVGRASPEQILHATEMVKQELLVTMSSEKIGRTTGFSKEPEQVFTTREMLKMETEIIQMLKDSQNNSHFLEKVKFPATLQGEQRAAAIAVTKGGNVSVVEGTAGAGKTYTMKAIKEAFENEGYKATGLSSSWAAALNLAAEAKLSGKATTEWVSSVKRGETVLDQKTLVIIDEAGMVGSKQVHQVLELVTAAGGKVVMLGDTLQQSSVSAGDPLRMAVNTIGSSRLDVIRRQKHADDRASVKQFFDGNASDALAQYIKKDAVHIKTGELETNQKLISDWQASHSKKTGDAITFHRDGVDHVGTIQRVNGSTLDLKTSEGKSFEVGNSHLIIGLTKVESAELNRLAHDARKQAGELGEGHLFSTLECEKDTDTVEFSSGDEVVFRANVLNMGIFNKNVGVIEFIRGSVINIRVQDGRVIDMDTNDPKWEHADGKLGLSHAYATTAYSSQGLTIDNVFVKNASFNREQAGVAMSRHRESVNVYVDKQAQYEKKMIEGLADDWQHISKFSDQEAMSLLAKTWSRAPEKISSIDYNHWATLDGVAFDAKVEVQIDNVDAARAKAAQEIALISNSCKSVLDKIDVRQELPFQRLSRYILKDPVTDHAVLTKSIEKLTNHGVNVDVLLSASQSGFIKFSKDGIPVFCGRRPHDNALVNIRPDGKIDPKSLRDGYPPILKGNTGRIDIVSSGHDALALWSSQQPDKRSTIIVAGDETQALRMPHTRRMIEEAVSVQKYAPRLSERLAETKRVQVDVTRSNSVEANPESKSQVADTQAKEREAQRAS